MGAGEGDDLERQAGSHVRRRSDEIESALGQRSKREARTVSPLEDGDAPGDVRGQIDVDRLRRVGAALDVKLPRGGEGRSARAYLRAREDVAPALSVARAPEVRGARPEARAGPLAAGERCLAGGALRRIGHRSAQPRLARGHGQAPRVAPPRGPARRFPRASVGRPRHLGDRGPAPRLERRRVDGRASTRVVRFRRVDDAAGVAEERCRSRRPPGHPPGAGRAERAPWRMRRAS